MKSFWISFCLIYCASLLGQPCEPQSDQIEQRPCCISNQPCLSDSTLSFAYCQLGQDDFCQECDTLWDIWIYPRYFSLGLTNGKGLGWKKGYTTFGFFTDPIFLNPCCRFQHFINVKGHVFVDGKWAANAGIVTRYLLPSCDMVIGANIYYDYRSFQKQDFNQIGVGLEMLTPIVDIRMNGYIPFHRTHNENRLIDFQNGSFAIHHERITAWSGFDAEIGTWMINKYPCNWFGLYCALGPYYYFRERDHDRHFGHGGRHNILGGRVRLLARICEFVDVALNATYDPHWHTRINGEISVTIPFDRITSLFTCQNSSGCETPLCLQNQIAIQPVSRNEIIVADRQSRWLSYGADSSSNSSRH